MMFVDMQIAMCCDLEVHFAMACNLVEHMIKKAEAGFDLSLAGAVDIQRDFYLRFVGVAVMDYLSKALAKELVYFAPGRCRQCNDRLQFGHPVLYFGSTQGDIIF